MVNLASARIAPSCAGKLLRFFVALPSVRDLLLWAKLLSVEARVAIIRAGREVIGE